MAVDGKQRPIRILQILKGLSRGGIETFLVHVLRHIDREKYQIDFLIEAGTKRDYDEEVSALGSRIIDYQDPGHPLLFLRSFFRAVKEYGPYDIVHSHNQFSSGCFLLLARLAGIHRRIAHAHSDTEWAQKNAGLVRRYYLKIMRKLVGMFATSGLAASKRAAEDLYGSDWQKTGKWSILHCGIDFEPFRVGGQRADIRKEFGFEAGDFVVGHVGRIEKPKNHDFLLDVFTQIIQAEKHARLLLVGEGTLENEVRNKAELLGVADKVVFAGVRSDIARLMKYCMDVFVMPSLYEGLPLVLIESQAAGLPAVISDRITDELNVVNGLVIRRSLSDEPALWAQAALEARRETAERECLVLLDELILSDFNIEKSVRDLESLYANA